VGARELHTALAKWFCESPTHPPYPKGTLLHYTEINPDHEGNEEERRSTGGHEIVKQETANVLLVGDRVNLFADQPGAPYGWGTVVKVTEEWVEIIRPHVVTSDFSVSPGWQQVGEALMHSLGWETVKIDRKDKRILHVVATVPK
jgi:hypothetical protein